MYPRFQKSASLVLDSKFQILAAHPPTPVSRFRRDSRPLATRGTHALPQSPRPLITAVTINRIGSNTKCNSLSIVKL